MKIRTYFELGNKNTTYQNLWDEAKALFRENIIILKYIFKRLKINEPNILRS